MILILNNAVLPKIPPKSPTNGITIPAPDKSAHCDPMIILNLKRPSTFAAIKDPSVRTYERYERPVFIDKKPLYQPYPARPAVPAIVLTTAGSFLQACNAQ